MLVGLQIHAIISNKKLHCSCKYHAVNKRTTEAAIRQSIGSLRYRTHRYWYNPANCAYQLDDAIPLPPTTETLAIAANIANRLGATILPQYRIDRKLILDGSLVAGFQRTGIYAVGGNYHGIPLREFRLQQDSCKRYRAGWVVNRQGLPLVQITTEPFQYATDLRQILLGIGAIIKSFTTVRGIGTIRQDINIDAGWGKTEIKGLQDLQILATVVATEAERQRTLTSKVIGFTYRIEYTLDGRILVKGLEEPLLWRQVQQHLQACHLSYELVQSTIHPGPNFKYWVLTHILASLRLGVNPTVRAANPDGTTRILRSAQSSARYILETILPAIKTVKPTMKYRMSPEQRLFQDAPEESLLRSAYTQLRPLGHIRYGLLHRIKKALLDGVVTRYQIPWMIERLLEKPVPIRILLSAPQLQPLSAEQLLAIAKCSTTLAKFRHSVLSTYRHRVYDAVSMLNLINTTWSNIGPS